MKKPDGGAAFPTLRTLTKYYDPMGQTNSAYYAKSSTGMTVRQFYAAMAMQGLASQPEIWADSELWSIAEDAYAMADAMLAFEENEAKK